MIDNKYFDKEIFENEVPIACPFCLHEGKTTPTLISDYSVECSGEDCKYYQNIIEEIEPERPDNYDWVLNK